MKLLSKKREPASADPTAQFLLEQAIDERAKIIAALLDTETSLPSLSCLAVSLRGNCLTLETSSVRKAIKGWIGLRLECYFKLGKAGRPGLYHTFTSQIVDIQEGDHCILILLSLPQQITVGQRRSSIRIELPTSHLRGLSLWPEDRFIRRTEDRSSGTRLHDPIVSASLLAAGGVRIQDISAGGMRLWVSGQAQRQHSLKLEKGAHYFVWLVLSDTRQTAPEGKLTLWLKATVNNVLEDKVTRDTAYGLEFSSEGIIDDKGKLRWRRVADNNVIALGVWTHAIHMEQVRSGKI